MIRQIVFCIGLLAFLNWGCSDLGTEPEKEDKILSVTFSGTIQPIFDNDCSLPGCHVPGHSSGLDLSKGNSYDNLVNVISSGYSPLKRVEPGEVDSSVLYLKVKGNPSTGDRMPLGGSLSESEVSSIKTWIDEGAKDS